jgi:DNA polymerase III subunit delta'
MSFPHPKHAHNFFGHTKILSLYEASYQSNSLHHAYLLVGEKGIGKATFAYQAAALLLSNTAKAFSQIDKEVVNQISRGSHPDILTLELSEDEKEMKIEAVRKITAFTSLTPAMSPNKVIIIDSINDLNNNSTNALLKLLEEPTPNTFFLLVCHSLGNILPTIRSRCSLINFAPLGFESFSKIISQHKKFGSDHIKEIYELSNGSISRAETFLDEELLSMYKKFEEAIITKSLSKLEVIKLCKSVTNNNWKIIKHFLEQILTKKLKSFRHDPIFLGKTIDNVTTKLDLINKADKFHVDKVQLCLNIISD